MINNMDNLKYNISLDVLMPVLIDQIEKGEICSIRVKGDSMHPFLVNERDMVFLEKVGTRKIRVGDIIMFRRQNGMYIMHRVYQIKNKDTFDFVGDAQFFIEQNIKRENFVAYISSVTRNGKKISCDKGLWRSIMILYMKFRIMCPRLTRVLIKIFRLMKKLING